MQIKMGKNIYTLEHRQPKRYSSEEMNDSF